MVKVVLVGRRQSNVISVNNLYFINENYKRKIPEVLEVATYGRKIHFLCLLLIPFRSFEGHC